MATVYLSNEDIDIRGVLVQELLKPISASTKNGPSWGLPSRTTRTLVIAAHDGNAFEANFPEWRFQTFVPEIRAMYYEIWDRAADHEDRWYLKRAYLHILKFDSATGGEAELILLHCDPSDDPEEPEKPQYKRVPHLHFHGDTRYPFTKAHIALTVGYFDQVLSSSEALTGAMSSAVLMVKKEVLDRVYKYIKEIPGDKGRWSELALRSGGLWLAGLGPEAE